MYIHKYITGWVSLATKAQTKDSDTQALHQIVLTLNRINEKLETIITINQQILKINDALLQKTTDKTNPSAEFSIEPDVMTMLNLPSALRKTIMVLYKLEKATADDLAKETNRLRAVESAAANELVRMGYIKKKREGRDVYFYIETPEEKKMYG